MTENEAREFLGRFSLDRIGYASGKEVDTDRFNYFTEALMTAMQALTEIQQYRAIGTVEECREARERQMGKKPNHFYKKYGKHQWRRKDSGEIDEDAWDSDAHSGVVCEVCGECVCTMCNPDYDELDDCEEEYWICPNCGKKIYCKDEYCKCGQHLDWSDTQRPTK